MAKSSLFKIAQPTANRLKVYIYGDTGTGKTVTALQFPNPVVFDAEKGTDHYGKFFKFSVLKSSKIDDLDDAITEMLEDPGEFKTFIIDPFSSVYDAWVIEWENKLKVKLGQASYVIQPKDYQQIKKRIKSVIDKLLALDLNIIVTARAKPEYSKEEFMKVIGVKADGPDSLPYMFDTVLELKKGPNEGEFLALAKKDRTNTLPKEWFPFTYQTFVNSIGMEGLDRPPVVFNQKINLESKLGRNTEITFKGQTIKTAGISASSLEQLGSLAPSFGEDKLKIKLQEDYGTDSFLNLKEDEAQLLIKEITTV